MHVIRSPKARSGGSAVDSALDYQSRDRRFNHPILRSFGRECKQLSRLAMTYALGDVRLEITFSCRSSSFKVCLCVRVDQGYERIRFNNSRALMARTVMTRLPWLTRTRSWIPIVPYMRFLWSNFPAVIFIFCFSDRWSLKIENENNNTKTLSRVPKINL